MLSVMHKFRMINFTIVHLPVGNPTYTNDEYWKLNKILYGLQCSPQHWLT